MHGNKKALFGEEREGGGGRRPATAVIYVCVFQQMQACDLLFVRRRCACLRRYLVAVGGMALQQQRREQLDQALGAEDTALLQQKGVLEPAIPQPSGVGREAGAVARAGALG